MPHKANCGVDDTEMRLFIEKHFVETRSMKVYPNSHTRLETQMEMANSRLCVGQDCFGMVWRRRMEDQKKSIRRQRTREFVTFARMIVKHSVAHRPTCGILCIVSQTRKRKQRTLGPTMGPPDSLLSIRTEGTTVHMCGDSTNCRKREQWALRDGPKSTRIKLIEPIQWDRSMVI